MLALLTRVLSLPRVTGPITPGRRPNPGLHLDEPAPPRWLPVSLRRPEDRVAAALDFVAALRPQVSPEVAVALDDLALILGGGA